MRLIDADSLEEVLRGTVCADAMCDSFHRIMTVIDISPTVDAQPVRHGHMEWKMRHSNTVTMYTGFDENDEKHTIRVFSKFDGKLPYCSECGKALNADDDYCNHCGARMDAKEDVNNG